VVIVAPIGSHAVGTGELSGADFDYGLKPIIIE
jgi:hypothetical protein